MFDEEQPQRALFYRMNGELFEVKNPSDIAMCRDNSDIEEVTGDAMFELSFKNLSRRCVRFSGAVITCGIHEARFVVGNDILRVYKNGGDSLEKSMYDAYVSIVKKVMDLEEEIRLLKLKERHG